jgi:Ca2+-binding EF-hand superfamily protein
MFGPYSFREVMILKKMFDSFDVDGSGTVDLEEFVNSPIFKSSHLASNADSMFEAVDKDSSGEVNVYIYTTVNY